MRFFALLLFALTALTPPVAAQSDWAAVRQQLPPGKEVSVETTANGAIIGKLAAVSDSAVVVNVKGRDRSIPRSDVRRISRRAPPRSRALITGAGVAAGVAVALVAAVVLGNKQCGESCDGEKAAMAGVLVGLPVGGGLLGRYLAGKGKWELVYSSAP